MVIVDLFKYALVRNSGSAAQCVYCLPSLEDWDLGFTSVTGHKRTVYPHSVYGYPQ
jgi:hypothetical protein